MNFPRQVYAIKHNATNRVYIGSSDDVERRFKSHLNKLRAHKHHIEDMQADFDLYGENYTFTVLEDIVKFDDKSKEYEWMKKYQSHIRGIGYNYKDHAFLLKQHPSKYTFTFNGKTMSIGKWAEEVGLPYQLLYHRLCVLGWDVEKALFTPCRKGATMTEKEFLTENEKELLELIRNSDNPQMAMYKVVGIVSEFETKISAPAYHKG